MGKNAFSRTSEPPELMKTMPRGSIGHQLLGKQGAPCSTCVVRRRLSTAAARAYIASKKKWQSIPQPKASSGLARNTLKREGLLKGPGERKESRLAKAKALQDKRETDDAEASEGGESVEPEGYETG